MTKKVEGSAFAKAPARQELCFTLDRLRAQRNEGALVV
jgi:hypothetical protein